MKKLAGLRVTAGFTQAGVAKMIGVTQGAISSWEKNKKKPSLDKIPQLARLYGVSEQEIISACMDSPATTIITQTGGS